MAKPLRILVVDLHDEVRDRLAASLNAREGFEVVLATSDLDTATERCYELSPDVLLVDIRQMEGAVTFCRDLKRVSTHSKLIVLSSLVSEWERSVFREIGASAFLSKEGSFRSLVANLRLELAEIIEGG